jgi:DNA topoisomerase-2
MAQDFVGSNNINLFEPIGQFGTRLMGGKDHSSARYIFTHLSKITRYIFVEEDDELLTYLEDDGYKIEPEYYVPIIPMVLINGCEGIGTGYSTYIPKFNPLDIIAYIKNKLFNLSNKKTNDFVPWYRGFVGKITKLDKFTYQTDGTYSIDKKNKKKNKINMINIKELPIMVWTDNYKQFLENNITDKFINNSTESTVDFIIDTRDLLANYADNNMYKTLNLSNRLNLTNMYLFDHTRQIKKYSSIKEIIDEYYMVRLELYDKRKKNILSKLKIKLNILESKIKFINQILEKKLELYNLSKDKIIEILKKHKFYLIVDEQPYDYLIRMSFYSFTKERIDELQKSYNDNKRMYKDIFDKTIEQLYLDDLEKLEQFF